MEQLASLITNVADEAGISEERAADEVCTVLLRAYEESTPSANAALPADVDVGTGVLGADDDPPDSSFSANDLSSALQRSLDERGAAPPSDVDLGSGVLTNGGDS